jgi:hypothetical protein
MKTSNILIILAIIILIILLIIKILKWPLIIATVILIGYLAYKYLTKKKK